VIPNLGDITEITVRGVHVNDEVLVRVRRQLRNVTEDLCAIKDPAIVTNRVGEESFLEGGQNELHPAHITRTRGTRLVLAVLVPRLQQGI